MPLHDHRKRVSFGTVQTIADLADQAKFQSPTVIVVGEVVRLGRELHWFTETVIDDRSRIVKVLENSVELRDFARPIR